MRFLLLSLFCFTLAVRGEEKLSSDAIAGMAAKYLKKVPISGVPNGIPSKDALKAQKQYVEIISKELGPKVGYKVGLVTKAGQERMGATGPVRGVLLKKMLLPDKATVPVTFATRPAVEADLIVIIKDSGINRATSIEEVAEHVSEIVAFIELPDSAVSTDQKMDGGVIEATNVGARSGVLGQRMKIQDPQELIYAFGKMQMILVNKEGKEVIHSSSEMILSHPLNALLWLVEDLKKTHEKLRAGDIISLGSPVPAITPTAGETYTLRYEGLAGGTLTASVSFEP